MTDFLSDMELPPALNLEPEFVKPPLRLAAGALLLGAMSALTPLAVRGRLGFIGWGLGFLAITTAIAYRWVLRGRQTKPLYLPNVLADRLMLVGVLFGFIGIVLNAYFIAQRVVT